MKLFIQSNFLLASIICVFFANVVLASGHESISASMQNVGCDGKKVTAKPVIGAMKALNGARVMVLSDRTSRAVIHYTLDGSTPSLKSPIYTAPVLIASSMTVKALASATDHLTSSVASREFKLNIKPDTLVWADEFNNHGRVITQPDSQVWGYDTGDSGWGNSEQEYYCVSNSNSSPCASNKPNSFIETDGVLHLVARQPAPGVYTSARINTMNRFSFKYGRVEIRARIVEDQGLWPAFWLLGNNIESVGWPACGEMDILEHVNMATDPDWNTGSVHGSGFIDTNLMIKYLFPKGAKASDWHTYGMIWQNDSISYYIDDPSKPYATFTPADIQKFSGSSWSFDKDAAFIIFNIAIGGNWPGAPNAATVFPAEFAIDYVRIYSL